MRCSKLFGGFCPGRENMQDMSGYRSLFISEMRTNLEALEDSISLLKGNPTDVELINEVFRITHTIKGMSATMGYNITADLAHKMEDLMSRIRDGEMKEGDINLLMEGSDMLNELLEDIVSTGQDISVDMARLTRKYEERLVRRIPPSARKRASEDEDAKNRKEDEKIPLTAIKQDKTPLSSVTKKGWRGEMKTYEVRINISDKSLLKDVRAAVVMEKLKKKGVVKTVIPSAEDIESENFDGNLIVLLETNCEPLQLEKEILSVREVKTVSVREAADAPKREGKSRKKRENTDLQSVRVSIFRLNELQSLIEELVVQKGRLNNLASSMPSPDLNDIASVIESIVSELTGVALELRLVPAEYMFRRFQRIVRTIAREQGKEVNLVVEGDNIEMDRPVLEMVGEAIIHLIKNSIDHGIEPPHVRRDAGKDPVGHIWLRVARERGYSVFIVEDDGRGIDSERVAEIAVKKGIITREEAARMSEEDRINLIFRPGLSTTREVTSVSGRVVGMDVVMNILKRIGGTVEIETGPGAGTVTTLRLPFTTAIIEALIVRIGRERYVVPLQAVLSILSVYDVKKGGLMTTIAGEEVVVYKEDFYPVLDVYPHLSSGTSEKKLTDGGYLLLIQHGRAKFALPVDNILGKDDMVVKPVEPLSNAFRTFSAATVMGDGSVAFVLDFPLLMKWGGISG